MQENQNLAVSCTDFVRACCRPNKEYGRAVQSRYCVHPPSHATLSPSPAIYKCRFPLSKHKFELQYSASLTVSSALQSRRICPSPSISCPCRGGYLDGVAPSGSVGSCGPKYLTLKTT